MLEGARIVRFAIASLCFATAACGVRPVVDTATLPFAAFGTMDNDMSAANQAAWAFAAPARTANDPVDAARAVAGALASNPRWLMVSPLTKQQMLQGRLDVPRALGIAPGASSQVVVNALVRFASAWQSGDQTGALPALAAPGFSLRPDQTLRLLSDMPYVRSANVASIDAANQMLPSGDNRHSG